MLRRPTAGARRAAMIAMEAEWGVFMFFSDFKVSAVMQVFLANNFYSGLLATRSNF